MFIVLQDAAAAALFTACKIEDTLKKSRDILCAAYNLKVLLAEQLTPDDVVSFCFRSVDMISYILSLALRRSIQKITWYRKINARVFWI